MLARKAHLVHERLGPLDYAECISRAAAANTKEERDTFLEMAMSLLRIAALAEAPSRSSETHD
jgi:hypothetical protein